MGRCARGTSMNTIITQLNDAVKNALRNIADALSVQFDDTPISDFIEMPKDKNHGDFATTAPLKLAKLFKKAPRDIAALLCDRIKSDASLAKILKKIEIAGPGFINFSLLDSTVHDILQSILHQGQNYSRNSSLLGQKILLEFVSANPTGPLNAVSARAAAVGDVLASLLHRCAADVHREFYVNDFGNQVNLLGKSLKARCLQLLNHSADIPAEGYHGEYLIDMAKDLILKYGHATTDKSEDFFADYAIATNVAHQKRDLTNYRVAFDEWFSEKTIHQNNLLEQNISALKKSNHLYEKEEKLWFRSTDFGDELDRVVVRDNGIPTYFMADIAYHQNKYERGYTRLIDIWGPDHHGYIPRLSGAIQALGHPKESFTVLIVQQVNLVKDGVPVKMSKRAGKFVLMDDVISEVGTDAARFFFVMRSTDSPLDFDLELAKKQTADNPCFYVQYAHARIHSIYDKAREQCIDISNLNPSDANLALLTDPTELELIKKMGQFPSIIELCGKLLEIHHLPYYLYDLASLFHLYFNLGKEQPHLRIIGENTELTKSRLALISALKNIIQDGLALLGVSAPTSM